MSHPKPDIEPEPGQTTLSLLLPLGGVLFLGAAILGFLSAGWIIGFCFLAVAGVFFSLGAIIDLLREMIRSLRRLESDKKKSEKA